MADRFALPLQETLDMNGWTIMTPDERASMLADLASEHEEICSTICQRLSCLATHAGRPFPGRQAA